MQPLSFGKGDIKAKAKEQSRAHIASFACLDGLHCMYAILGRAAKDLVELALSLRQVDCQHANESALADPICLQHP